MVLVCTTPSGGIPAVSTSGPTSNGTATVWGVDTQSGPASRGITSLGLQTIYNCDTTAAPGSVLATLQVSKGGRYFLTSWPNFLSAATPEGTNPAGQGSFPGFWPGF
jgi:hypothetical protein